MNEEEITKVIERRNSTSIPLFYKWIAQETWEKYGNSLKDMLRNYRDDFLIVGYGLPEGSSLKGSHGQTGFDEWGCRWEKTAVGNRVVEYPLDDLNNLNDYLDNFPDPYAESRFDRVQTVWYHGQLYEDYNGGEVNITKLVGKNKNFYMVGLVFPTINEKIMGFMPAENYWTYLHTRKEEILRLVDKLVQFHLGIIDQYGDLGLNAVWFSDDWGSQDRLMIAPEMWRRIFRPWYQKLFKKVHDEGMHVWFHSCGKISEILPDFVKIGVDVFHLGQPYVMEIEKIVRQLGREVCFFSGMDVQVLPKLTRKQVKKEILRAVEIFSRPGGGFILGPTNSIMPETPLENIEAMCEQMSKFGG